MTPSPLVAIAAAAALAAATVAADARRVHHRSHRTAPAAVLPPPAPDRAGVAPRRPDPIYESCEYPWRHLEAQCPLGR